MIVLHGPDRLGHPDVARPLAGRGMSGSVRARPGRPVDREGSRCVHVSGQM